MPTAPDKLTVLYDAKCTFCTWCRAWVEKQSSFLPTDFINIHDLAPNDSFSNIPWIKHHIVVTDNHGNIWAGPAAMIVCLWSLKNWRSLAYILSAPFIIYFSKHFFEWVSNHRSFLTILLGIDHCENNQCMVSPKIH